MKFKRDNWKYDSDILSDWIQISEGIEELCVRRKVFGGWIIYRDLFKEDQPLTSTVIFIEDKEHLWVFEGD